MKKANLSGALDMMAVVVWRCDCEGCKVGGELLKTRSKPHKEKREPYQPFDAVLRNQVHLDAPTRRLVSDPKSIRWTCLRMAPALQACGRLSSPHPSKAAVARVQRKRGRRAGDWLDEGTGCSPSPFSPDA